MNIQDRINKAKFPIVVKASAGTGKTYCLVEKVNHLVRSGINPVNILVFTFTLDAANELKNRIQNGQQMTVGTIHSVMLQIIREHHPKRYNVLDNGRQSKFVFDMFKEEKIDFDNYNRYMSNIGMAKNIFTKYQKMLDDNPEYMIKYFDDERLFDFATKYEIKKEQYHKIDFDDMTLKAYGLLSSSPNILDNRQERWKYIFVDEAQDLCQPQIDIIKLLANKYKNLFIVGDEKQAIYGSFRASTPEFLHNFREYYPACNEFILPTTYRCSEKVCKAGNMIAARIDGSEINTANKIAGTVDMLGIFETQSLESKTVACMAVNLFKNTNKSIKVLYRTNAQSLGFQMSLIKSNVPFSVNQVNSVFSSKEYKVAIGMCKFLYEYDRADISAKIDILKSIRPILHYRYDIYNLIKQMEHDRVDFFETRSYKLCGIVDELTQIKTSLIGNYNSPSDVFMMVSSLTTCRYFSSSASDNLLGIAEFIRDCKTLKEVIALVEEVNKPRIVAKDERVVSLSTIHGSKGLEADIVFLTGIADGVFPHKAGIPEEERNLLYVGVTRARESLYLSGFYMFGEREFTEHSYMFKVD